MTWYKNVLAKYKKEIISSAIFSIFFSLSILLWHYGLGKSFTWIKIEPFSAPNLVERYFYSAFVFVTFGAFLYWIRFYQFLHILTVRVLGDWGLFRDIKRFVWGSLILVSYFWVVPKFVDVMNGITSFFYNLFGLVLYSFPALGIALTISIPSFVYIKKYLH
jgi:hypothetical protein